MLATKSIIEEERVQKFKKTLKETQMDRGKKARLKAITTWIGMEPCLLIELLIKRGHVNNRSEFIRAAIEEKLALTIDDLVNRELFSNGKVY